ncbi:MAG: chromate transporter [Clostridia bacterium]
MKNFWKSIISSFKIGAIGFGGGSALIPVCEKECVDDNHYISEEDFNENVIVSNITPGALPVKLCSGIGNHASGNLSGVLSAFAVGFTGVFLTVLIYALISIIGEQGVKQIEYASIGISAFIIYLLFHYIGKVQKSSNEVGFGKISVAIIVISVVVTFGKEMVQILGDLGLTLNYTPILNISTIELLIMAFFVILFTNGQNKKFRTITAAVVCLGFLYSVSSLNSISFLPYIFEGIMVVLAIVFVIIDAKSEIKPNTADETEKTKRSNDIKKLLKSAMWFGVVYLVMLALTLIVLNKNIADVISFSGLSIVSTVTSFGGGEAYLTVAEGMFVEGGFIGSDVFFSQIVPIANALPGPILAKILTGVSYVYGLTLGGQFGGIMMALLGFATAVGFSCIAFYLVFALFRLFSNLSVFDTIKKWILPVIAGMLISTCLAMVHEMFKITGATIQNSLIGLAIIAVMFIAAVIFKKKFKLQDIFCIIILAVSSITVMNVLNIL